MKLYQIVNPIEDKCSEIFLDLETIKGISITDRCEVQSAINTFQSLTEIINECIFQEMEIFEACSGITNREVIQLFDIFKRHFDRLKKEEGINFDAVWQSLLVCVNLAPIFLEALADYRDLFAKHIPFSSQ